MTRTTARQLAVQLSFAVSAGSSFGPEDFLEEDFFRSLPAEESMTSELPDPAQKEYICALVNGIRDRRDELDGYISRYSRGWKISRISRTALSVLRCAIYEILYMPDISDAASVNEAVELAKKFDEPETVSFINGILGSFLRERDASVSGKENEP